MEQQGALVNSLSPNQKSKQQPRVIFYESSDKTSQYFGSITKSLRNGLGALKLSKKGVKYLGQVNNVDYSGTGILLQEAESWYIGEFNEGVSNGIGKLFCPKNGQKIGKFKSGFDSFLGVFKGPNGGFECGNFVDSSLEGIGARCSSEGTVIGNFENGLISGFSIVNTSSVDQMKGTYYKGKKCGPSKAYKHSKCVEYGFYQNDKKDGYFREFDIHKSNNDDSIIFEGIYQAGRRIGVAKCFINGAQFLGEMIHGAPSGFGRLENENLGEIYVGEFKNGLKEGLGFFRSKNQSYFGIWKNGFHGGQGYLLEDGNEKKGLFTEAGPHGVIQIKNQITKIAVFEIFENGIFQKKVSKEDAKNLVPAIDFDLQKFLLASKSKIYQFENFLEQQSIDFRSRFDERNLEFQLNTQYRKLELSIEQYKQTYYSTIAPRASQIWNLLKEKNSEFLEFFFENHKKAETEILNFPSNHEVKEQIDRLTNMYGFIEPTPDPSLANFEENQNFQNNEELSQNLSPDQRGRFNSLESIKTVKKYISPHNGEGEEEEKLVSETALLSQTAAPNHHQTKELPTPTPQLPPVAIEPRKSLKLDKSKIQNLGNNISHQNMSLSLREKQDILTKGEIDIHVLQKKLDRKKKAILEAQKETEFYKDKFNILEIKYEELATKMDRISSQNSQMEVKNSTQIEDLEKKHQIELKLLRNQLKIQETQLKEKDKIIDKSNKESVKDLNEQEQNEQELLKQQEREAQKLQTKIENEKLALKKQFSAEKKNAIELLQQTFTKEIQNLVDLKEQDFKQVEQTRGKDKEQILNLTREVKILKKKNEEYCARLFYLQSKANKNLKKLESTEDAAKGLKQELEENEEKNIKKIEFLEGELNAKDEEQVNLKTDLDKANKLKLTLQRTIEDKSSELNQEKSEMQKKKLYLAIHYK